MRCLIIADTRSFASCVTDHLLQSDCEVALLDSNPASENASKGIYQIFGSANELDFKKSDIENFNPDVAIHLAANNEAQTRLFCETMEGIASHLIVASSLNVYSANGRVYKTEQAPLQDAPLAEDAPLRTKPLTPDAANDKLHVERVMAESTIPNTILRLPPMYGPKDPLRRFYPLISRMLDERPHIAVSASQANWHWTHGYTSDIAFGIALAAQNPSEKNCVYNIGELKTPTIIERISHLATVLGYEGRIASLPDSELPSYMISPGDFDQDLEFDTSKIRTELEYKEPADYYDGLFESIEWYKGNPPPEYKGMSFNYEAEDALAALINKVERVN